jgi:DNA-directed RNA polymerase specialized sigma24 family protein
MGKRPRLNRLGKSQSRAFLKCRFDGLTIDQSAEEMTMDDDAKYPPV